MNFYEALGVSRNSEPEVIDAAYRALIKKYHPDRWRDDGADAEPRAKLINEAYATLRDPHRRRAYDKQCPPDAPRSARKRRVPAQAAPKSSTRQAARHRTGVQHIRATARATSRHALANDRMVPAMVIVACLGAMAMIALVSRGSSQVQPGSTQSILFPPVKASLLSAGRKQTVCITNKTLTRVDYTLYWGGTSGLHYALDPGYYMIHSSAFSTPPLVEFFDNDGGEPARRIVRSTVTSGNVGACEPNYSFQYISLDDTRWSGASRFGLYSDERARMAPPDPSIVKREWASLTAPAPR